MKTVILYGELAKRFGKHHRLAIKNAAEAIRALKANFKDFESYLCNAHHDGVGFKIFVGGTVLNEYREIHNPSGSSDVIRIVPVIMGSKSPVIRILIGVVLIAAAIILTVTGVGGPAAAILGSLGASMIIGGVVELLSPPPKTPGTNSSQPDNKTSYIFDGPANVSAQGAAVPVGYGRMIVGSVVISAGIETYEAL